MYNATNAWIIYYCFGRFICIRESEGAGDYYVQVSGQFCSVVNLVSSIALLIKKNWSHTCWRWKENLFFMYYWAHSQIFLSSIQIIQFLFHWNLSLVWDISILSNPDDMWKPFLAISNINNCDDYKQMRKAAKDAQIKLFTSQNDLGLIFSVHLVPP